MTTRFHISCCGRSGSKFIAAAIRNMGISVIHEMGDDWPVSTNRGVVFFSDHREVFANYQGIVGWKWSILTPDFARSFPVQMHMVRHPLKAIESATTHSDQLFDQVEAILGEPDFIPADADPATRRLGRAVHYWISYNTTFAAGKPLLRVEDFRPGGPAVRTFCDLTGTALAAEALISTIPTNVNARTNARKRVPVDPALLDRLYPRQADRLRSLAEACGYDFELPECHCLPDSLGQATAHESKVPEINDRISPFGQQPAD